MLSIVFYMTADPRNRVQHFYQTLGLPLSLEPATRATVQQLRLLARPAHPPRSGKEMRAHRSVIGPRNSA